MKISVCSPRFARFSALLSIYLAVLMFFAGEAAAFLHRVGPINSAPSVGNFPAWYQDTTGLTLEFCDPKSVSEVAGGWCLLLPADVPTPPEVFPTEFFDEHFWYAADAIPVSTNPLIKKAILVLAVEAAFAADVTPGGQIAFSRIRIRLDDVPVDGTYRFIHPYGEEIVEGVAGERIFFTDDVGIACALGDFSCALTSRLGPFLLPSDTPGGAELPAVVGPAPENNLYIADPARSGPVTGSTLPNFIDSTGASRNHNIFRIEGPEGSNLDGAGNDYIETTNFTLMGRIFTGALPGEVTVDRANYARNNAGRKVEVYATGFETTQGRLPGEDPAPAVMPVLSFFDAPCASALDNNLDPVPPFSAPVGATETQMFNADTSFWAQTQPAAIPVSVCVKDNVSLTYLPKTVGDEITITEAYFDPNAQSLSVKARSSDEVALPTLTLGGFADLANGAILVSPLAAPPYHVQVNSAGGGTNSVQVTTNPPDVPLPAIGASLFATPASPQPQGTAVTFIGVGEGGSLIYEYQFSYRLSGTPTYTLGQAYSSSSIWAWTTTAIPSGTYDILVNVRSAGSTTASEASATTTFLFTGTGAATNIVANPSLPSPQAPGASVLWTAVASGGTGSYQYQFWLHDGTSWSLAKPYGATNDNTWTWNTGGLATGSYSVQVWARSAGSTALYEAFTPVATYVLSTTAPATSVTLSPPPSPSSPQAPGASVLWTAVAGGGSGNYQYQFWLHNGTSWSLAKPYGATNDNTWTWNTGGLATGTYSVQVWARSEGSAALYEAFTPVETYVLQP